MADIIVLAVDLNVVLICLTTIICFCIHIGNQYWNKRSNIMLAHMIMDPIMAMIAQQLSAAESARQRVRDEGIAQYVNLMRDMQPTADAGEEDPDSDEGEDENGDEDPAPIPQAHAVVATA